MHWQEACSKSSNTIAMRIDREKNIKMRRRPDGSGTIEDYRERKLRMIGVHGSCAELEGFNDWTPED